jgi:hypothetical protein
MNKKSMFGALVIIMILAAIVVIAPPPTPHSIMGYIYQSDGSTQVPKGTNYSINDTTSGYFVKSATNFPLPEYSGRYFNTISGVDTDIVILRAWNTTHYGETIFVLNGDMSGINVWINATRAPETNVTIISPPNGTALNLSSYYNITARVGMLLASGSECNATIWLNDTTAVFAAGETVLHEIGSISLGEYAATSWNISGARDGSLRARIEAACANTNLSFAGLFISELNLSVRDITPPNITVSAPQNMSWEKNNVTVHYNVTDATGIRNCSIYIDSRLNQTTLIYPATEYNFTIENLAEGSHTWNITCYDNATLANKGNSSIFTINVDVTPPNITLLFPENNNLSSNNTVIFNYNVTENYLIANCSLIINGSVAESNASFVQGNMTQNFTKTLPRGLYNWTITCTDASNNTGEAASRLVNVIDADLAVGSIIFSTDNPYEDQSVSINATIVNYGDDAALNFNVRIYEVNSLNIWLLIDSFTLSIPHDANTSVNASWVAKPGTFNISVLADTPIATNGSVMESNELNNAGNKSIIVSIWNVYYGFITSDIVLGSGSNSMVFKWPLAINMTPNIYAADSDSNINWSGLLALAINSTGNLSLGDFGLADAALGITEYGDSINKTFTSSSRRKNVSAFEIFSAVVQNVSISLSTNNSNFTTGILWDASDSASGHYTGVEDLVFAAKVNTHSIGAFGQYDYELMVPARLKQYVLPNNYNTITFYTELT